MTGRLYFWNKAHRSVRRNAYHVELALAALHLRRRGLDPSRYGVLSV